MTRRSLNFVLIKVFIGLAVLLLIAFIAKISNHPGLTRIYEFINDMSLIVLSIVATYLAYVFQRRSTFLTSLRQEWREIVRTKAELITYCQNPEADIFDYLEAYRRISQSIDFMRIVYRNVGETQILIGLYPFEPLHDMRRALEDIDPRKGKVSPKAKQTAIDQIWDAFEALREYFLDEFDLEEPTRPLVGTGHKRVKMPGSNKIGPALAGSKHIGTNPANKISATQLPGCNNPGAKTPPKKLAAKTAVKSADKNANGQHSNSLKPGKSSFKPRSLKKRLAQTVKDQLPN